MEKVIYDLHTHSALSPCGDNDMTVNNMLNMAVLGGIQVMAITDHNSCKNCPAAVEVAKELPIDLIPGMELCTSEEVHVICLFGQLEQAMAFDAYVHDHLPPVKNRPEIFGEQRILNAADEIIGYEPYLLINATAISIEEVVPLVRRFGGICYPAHIDKSSTSVFSNLGYFSAHWGFFDGRNRLPGKRGAAGFTDSGVCRPSGAAQFRRSLSLGYFPGRKFSVL